MLEPRYADRGPDRAKQAPADRYLSLSVGVQLAPSRTVHRTPTAARPRFTGARGSTANRKRYATEPATIPHASELAKQEH
jgi:hypothetical protein